MDHLELVLICTGHRALHPVLLPLKPSSSAPNNAWSSNVLTPAPTHRPSCLSAPTCINRSVYSGVRTSFCGAPCEHWTAILWGRSGKPSISVHSAYSLVPTIVTLHFCIFSLCGFCWVTWIYRQRTDMHLQRRTDHTQGRHVCIVSTSEGVSI